MSGGGSRSRFWRTAVPSADPADVQQLRGLLSAAHGAAEALGAWAAAPTFLPADTAGAALDPRLQRTLALRTAAQPDAEAALLREARLRAALQHPCVPAVYGIAQDAAGRLQVVGPTTAGITLRSLLSAARRPGDLASAAKALRALARVADVVAHAHEHGVEHGAIDADRVLVGEHGEVWLTGWESARVGDIAAANGPDLRALGRLLRAIAAVHARPPLELLAIAECLEDGGYATACEFCRDLEALRRGGRVAALGRSRLRQLRAWFGRHRGPAAACAVLAATLVGGSWLVAATARASAREVDRERRSATARTERLQRLRDGWTIDQLLRRETGLWPALGRAAELQAWLDDVGQIAARLPDHLARAAVLGALAQRDTELEWELRALTQLLARSQDLDAARERVRARRELALALAAAHAEPDRQERWQAALAAIAAEPRYRGVPLRPRADLLPLWRETASPQGAWLFAHLPSGAPPARGGDGRPVLTPDTGVVLALVPGGVATIGTRPVSASHPSGSPFADRWHSELEAPLQEVALAAYFVSRYELTRAQWHRLMGDAVAAADVALLTGSPVAAAEAALLPAVDMTWPEAAEWCRRAGLALPTEAQWEHACRAGTTSVYWFGDDPGLLAEHGNVLVTQPTRPPRPAPVDAGGGNPFGLFGLHGNVAEFCRDWMMVDPPDARPGDGLRGEAGSERQHRVVRGGSWNQPARAARSGARGGVTLGNHCGWLGLRPAAPVE